MANLFKIDTHINITHQNLLSASPIQNQILYLLEGATTTDPYILSFKPTTSLDGLVSTVIRTDAPVTLVARDAIGNESGVLPIESLEGMYLAKEEIPNSSVQTYGDDTYIFVPQTNDNYDVSLTGRTEGSGSIEIGTQDTDGSITMQQTFPAVTVTASTTGTFSITDTKAGTMDLNVRGDNVTSTVSPYSEEDVIATDTPITITSTPEPFTSTQINSSHSSQKISNSSSTVHSIPSVMSPQAMYTLYLQFEIQLLTIEIKIANLLNHKSVS